MFLDAAWRRELVHAARRLRNAPGFAAVAIVTLAIGVGVNSAMFGLIDALLFRPPAHVVEPDRVVRLQLTTHRDSSPVWQDYRRAPYPHVEQLAATGAFASVAGNRSLKVSVGRGTSAVEAEAMMVTRDFFRALGVRPHAGSLIGSTGDAGLDANGIVLAYGFWQTQFGGDRNVIGSSIVIGDGSFVVLGIAPDGLALFHSRPLALWLSFEAAERAGYLDAAWNTQRGTAVKQFARLLEGVSADVAAQRAAALVRGPASDPRAPAGVLTASLTRSPNAGSDREVRISLWLAGVTAFVLLIACANLSNLMIARNAQRGREYAVRLSLGATHWQLRRQLIADIGAIAVPGMLAAVFVEWMSRSVISSFLASDLPMARGLFDARLMALMAFSGAIAVGLVLLVSLTQVRPEAIARSLVVQAGDQRRGGAWVRNSLLAVQAGLCMALLFSAGLFAKSLHNVLSLDLGVDMDRTVQIEFNLPKSHPPAEARALHERALERLRAHPAVEHVALGQSNAFRSGSAAAPYTAARSSQEIYADGPAYSALAGAGFFTAAGAPSLQGRDFTEADVEGAPRAAIINANLARKLFPNGNALDQCIFLDERRECYRVVGVLGGVWKLRALDRDQLALYLPLAQTDETPGALLVRTRGDPRRALGDLRTVVQSVQPDLPAVSVSRAGELVEWEFRPWRVGATLFVGFSFIALVIAAVGLYGVVSFTTTLRTREIGIRMALGARGAHIARVVSGAGLVAVTAGLVGGSAAALFASRWMGDVLYQTSPRDPVVLAETAGVLLAVAAVAVIVPVVRALRLAPAAILRAE